MTGCTAINCTNRDVTENRQKGMTFHRYPLKTPQLLEKWIASLKRIEPNGKLWMPTKHMKLCSAHFAPECFDRTGQTTRLRENAVPTIFDFPQHRVQKTSSTTSKKADAPMKLEDLPVLPAALTEHNYAIRPPPRKLDAPSDDSDKRRKERQKQLERLRLHRKKTSSTTPKKAEAPVKLGDLPSPPSPLSTSLSENINVNCQSPRKLKRPSGDGEGRREKLQKRLKRKVRKKSSRSSTRSKKAEAPVKLDDLPAPPSPPSTSLPPPSPPSASLPSTSLPPPSPPSASLPSTSLPPPPSPSSTEHTSVDCQSPRKLKRLSDDSEERPKNQQKTKPTRTSTTPKKADASMKIGDLAGPPSPPSASLREHIYADCESPRKFKKLFEDGEGRRENLQKQLEREVKKKSSRSSTRSKKEEAPMMLGDLPAPPSPPPSTASSPTEHTYTNCQPPKDLKRLLDDSENRREKPQKQLKCGVRKKSSRTSTTSKKAAASLRLDDLPALPTPPSTSLPRLPRSPRSTSLTEHSYVDCQSQRKLKRLSDDSGKRREKLQKQLKCKVQKKSPRSSTTSKKAEAHVKLGGLTAPPSPPPTTRTEPSDANCRSAQNVERLSDAGEDSREKLQEQLMCEVQKKRSLQEKVNRLSSIINSLKEKSLIA